LPKKPKDPHFGLGTKMPVEEKEQATTAQSVSDAVLGLSFMA